MKRDQMVEEYVSIMLSRGSVEDEHVFREMVALCSRAGLRRRLTALKALEDPQPSPKVTKKARSKSKSKSKVKNEPS